MDAVPSPDDVEPGTVLPLDTLNSLLRSWRNHWAAVERIARDFPEDVKSKTLLRPEDPGEALAETQAQFAVLFHPEAISAFVSYLNAAIDTVEAIDKRDGDVLSDVPLGRDPDKERLEDMFARLEERFHLLDLRLEEFLERGRAEP